MNARKFFQMVSAANAISQSIQANQKPNPRNLKALGLDADMAAHLYKKR